MSGGRSPVTDGRQDWCDMTLMTIFEIIKEIVKLQRKIDARSIYQVQELEKLHFLEIRNYETRKF